MNNSVYETVIMAMPADKPDLLIGKYQHYRGPFYQVLHVARHSETEEWLVVYQALYGDYGIWVRPAAMFVEMVTPTGDVAQPRFRYCG